MSQTTAAPGHTQDDNKSRAPEGYTREQIALCAKLTSNLVAEMRKQPGHVVLSVLLTTYVQISSEYGPAALARAANYMVMTGNGLLSEPSQGQGDLQDPALIAQAITGFISTRRHGPTLDALLMVFKALAQKFPCCTGLAAAGAHRVAAELTTAAALSSPPTSLHVH